MLGEFEYLLISTAARLGDNAYGAAIREGIEEIAQRKCSIGSKQKVCSPPGWVRQLLSVADAPNAWSASPAKALVLPRSFTTR
jgi:hypothetical protein